MQYGVDKAMSLMYRGVPEPCDPTSDKGSSCPVPEVPELPPLLQIPFPEYRAVKTDLIPFMDLPSESCRRTKSCPATILITGNNKSVGEGASLCWSLCDSSKMLSSMFLLIL